MVDEVLEPTRSRTATTLVFVIVAALLWIAPPAAAQECPQLTIDPPNGQFTGGTLVISFSFIDPPPPSSYVKFSLVKIVTLSDGTLHERRWPISDNVWVTDPPQTSFAVSAQLPRPPQEAAKVFAPGIVTLMHSIGVPVGGRNYGQWNEHDCPAEYTVLAGMAPLDTGVTGVTDTIVPLDTIDTTSPTTSPTTPATPTTAPPTTSPTTTPTTVPLDTVDTTTTTTTPTTVPLDTVDTTTTTTTVAVVETSTTLPESASAAADTTLVAAAPQSDDDSSSSDEMLIGLLIGAGAMVVIWSAWALGRRGRTPPTY